MRSQMRAALAALVFTIVFCTGAGQALASHGGGSPPPPPPPPTSPVASVSPSSLTYASQDVGTTSAAQTVAVSNTGNAALFVNGLSQAGINPIDYVVTDDQCSGVSVAPGSSCTLSIAFKPVATGTRTATVSVLDNAASSPQAISLSGTATSTSGPTPLTIDTEFFTCAGGTCDIGAGSNVFVNNFFFSDVTANGGTAPFVWSISAGALPAGMTLTPAGLIYGSPAATGSYAFTVKVTDATGATATQPLSLTVTGPPPPSPPGCQHAPGKVTEPLTGAAIAGKVPSGQAVGDESQLTACGGFTTIAASVKDVNEPNGTVLWVSLDFKLIGQITLNGGSGTMKAYDAGDFGLFFDQIRIDDQSPPRVNGQTDVLAGSFFN